MLLIVLAFVASAVSAEVISFPLTSTEKKHSELLPHTLTEKTQDASTLFPFVYNLIDGSPLKGRVYSKHVPAEFAVFEKQSLAQQSQALHSVVDAAFRSDAFKASSESVQLNLRTLANPYSSTGSVYQSIFMNEDGTPDSTCSTLNAISGAFVNYCFVMDDYAYQFQLVSDNCDGGVIQYYNNTDCTSLFGTVDLQSVVSADTCTEVSGGSGVYTKLQCTTSGIAMSIEDGINIKSFQDADCGEVYGMYSSVKGSQCQSMGSGMYTSYGCSGDNAVANVYQSPTCEGNPIQSANLPNECLNQDSIDDYYFNQIQNPPPTSSGTPFPTMEPVQMSALYSCNSAKGGGSSSNGMSAGVMAGIIVGSVVGFVLVVAAIIGIVIATGAGAGAGAAASAPAAVV